jgi:hypothetical protein
MTPTHTDPGTPDRTARTILDDDPDLQTAIGVAYVVGTIVVLGLQCACYAGSIHSFIAVIATGTGWLTTIAATLVPILQPPAMPRRTRLTTATVALTVTIAFAVLPTCASDHGTWSDTMSALTGIVYDAVTATVAVALCRAGGLPLRWPWLPPTPAATPASPSMLQS